MDASGEAGAGESPAPSGTAHVVDRDASDVVTSASTIAPDPGSMDGGRVFGGTLDGAAQRAKNRKRLAQRSPVTVVRGASALVIGQRLCEAVVPSRPAETPVLLKPNIGGFDWFKDPARNGGDDGVKGRITDPEFVRGVVRCLRARGHQQITIAEGWGGKHADWVKLARVSGFAAMAEQEHVPLVAMDDDGVFDVEGDRPGQPWAVSGMEGSRVPTLLSPHILATHLQRGLFLSLPKIKAHRFGVVSLSVKGTQGTIMLSDASPFFNQKWRMHKELIPYLKDKKADDRAAYVAALEIFAERIVDVLEVNAPDAVLADGAPAMGGDGFQKLYPSDENVGIGGVNPVLVDRVGAELLGLWDVKELGPELGGHTSSPLLEAAGKRFALDLGPLPELAGDGADLLRTKRPTHFVAMAPFAIHADVPGDRPVAHAVHGTVVVDGRGDDVVWQRAPVSTWDTDTSGAATGVVTRVRLAWSESGLAALFEVESTDLHTDTTKPVETERARLYEEDCVELFLGSGPAHPRRYYEVEVGPYGHFLDLGVDLDRRPREDVAWSSRPTIAVTRDAARRRAVIEVQLGAAEITRQLVPGARLRLGLYRMEGRGARKYLAWSPPRTARPDFHVPSAFGSLSLDP